MKRTPIYSLAVALLASISVAGSISVARAADGPPEMPAPAKEHAWLKQLAGNWEANTKCYMEPGKPAMEMKGTESAQMLGGFWLIAKGESKMGDVPMHSQLTLGYDPGKKKYIGTWVDSMQSTLWQYEGTLDESQKVLTLETEGPCPMFPGKTAQFKEVLTIVSPIHKTFSSSIKIEDQPWTTIVEVDYKKKG